MKTAHIQHPNRGPAISWGMAMGILIGGVAMLAFAVVTSMPKKVEATKDTELETLLAEAAKNEKDLEAFRKTLEAPAKQLKDVENTNKALADSVAGRTKLVREVEAENDKKINEIREKIKALEGKKKDDQAKSAELDEKNIEKTREARHHREALVEMQNGVVSIVANKAHVVGTGVLFTGFKTPMVITSIPNAPAGEDLLVNISYLIPGFTNVQSARAKGKLVYTDKESGLAFISVTVGKIPLTTFNKEQLRAATATEDFTLITASLVPDRSREDLETEIILFDGIVSALEEISGDLKLMRVAVPANKGSSGAPLIASDKKMIGILFKAVEGVEKAGLAVTGPDILKAIERMQKK